MISLSSWRKFLGLIEGKEWPQQALALVELKEDEIHRLRDQQRAIEGGERINCWDSEDTKVFRRIGFVRIFGGFREWLNNTTREDFLSYEEPAIWWPPRVKDARRRECYSCQRCGLNQEDVRVL